MKSRRDKPKVLLRGWFNVCFFTGTIVDTRFAGMLCILLWSHLADARPCRPRPQFPNPSDALAMLAELKSLKLMPDLYTFNAVLDACFLHNDWQLALVVLSVSGRQRSAASIRIRAY
jgi:hypothetical protein